MNPKLRNYKKRGYKKVDGWMSPLAMHAIIEFDRIQKAESISGPVCEIGVHHGRLFILLHLLSKQSETCVAWDLFENQDENVDQSGSGDRLQLEMNLKQYGQDLRRVLIQVKNSLDLDSGEVVRQCEGHPRLFSIDGGHTSDITYNDIKIAAGSICDKGIIILDDFFNEAWSGVAEGASRYLNKHTGLSPVAILGNKVMLTNSPEAADFYLNRFKLTEPGVIEKRMEFYGREVICMLPLETNIIWKHLRGRPVGQFLKWIVNYFRS